MAVVISAASKKILPAFILLVNLFEILRLAIQRIAASDYFIRCREHLIKFARGASDK